MTFGGSPRGEFLATDHPYPGMQRLRAGFFGHAYDRHRHETCALGVTERGIEVFRYRGINRASTLAGTSPHRYLVGRRLRLVKGAIAAGEPLAEAALAGGFADQSHMTRHFKARFGLTPGRYAQLLRRSDRSAGHA